MIDYNDDVFVKTSVYGIHSPFNNHSFCTTMIYIPTNCVMCLKTGFIHHRSSLSSSLLSYYRNHDTF